MAYKTRVNRSYSSKPSNSKPKLFILLIIFGILGIIAFSVFGWYNSSINDIPANAPKGVVSFVVDKGNGFGDVGDKLVKQNTLKAGWSLPYLMQGRDKWTLQPGKYTIISPATPNSILDQMKKKSDEIAKKNINKVQTTVEITIKEGQTLDEIIDVLAQKEVADANELKKYAQNPQNFDRNAYSFLPQPLNCQYGQVSNCAKYYPEGYLYPDTYEFYQDETPKNIYNKLLNNFNTKVWDEISDKVGSKDFSKVVIMASVIEKETGRPIDGVNDSNIGALNEEKRKVAGVFYNRIENSMKWGSDPTVSYGTGKNLCQSTLTTQKDCLYLNSPEVQTKYNTYDNPGYPIGPISTPQLATIKAVLNPDDNQYLFFVADAAGKKYFSDSGDGHDANVARVIEINKQYR
jgi:UPF0755 protein